MALSSEETLPLWLFTKQYEFHFLPEGKRKGRFAEPCEAEDADEEKRKERMEASNDATWKQIFQTFHIQSGTSAQKSQPCDL